MSHATDFIAGAAVWLERQMVAAGAGGYVVGISGGIDSAVAAKLAIKGVGVNRVITIHLPVGDDAPNVRKVADWLGQPIATYNLSDIFEAFKKTFGGASNYKVVAGNLKARLRMCALYYVANARNYLVLGTGNRTEIELGYFTKYGDGGVDVLPLGSCLKGNVVYLAEEMGAPKAVLTAEPSAGLWEGQTDEGELGMKYGDIDWILKDRWCGEGYTTPDVNDLLRVRQLHWRSEHKRRMPPIYEFDWGNPR